MFDPVNPQPDFAAQEEAVLAWWQENTIFEKSVAKNDGKPNFVIYDGPPYANAKPPLHTMVPMSFKDLVGRYKTMRGYRVPRQAGWDTHGLPIEVQVEKALGLASKKDILSLVPGDERASIKKFNEICRTSVFEFKQDWDRFVPRVGYWTDTERPYVTYEPEYIERSWGVFKRIWDRELVYKGYKVLPYCPRCGTGLSAAEVAQEYHDVKDVSVYVAFPIVSQPGRSFLAWTTTPWTLPGNVALAVGPDIEYVAVKQEAGEYVLAKSRLEILKGDYEILETFAGRDLDGLAYEPLYPEIFADATEKKHVVVMASFVTTEDGTGIVHTAVMYGEDDFNLGKEVGLPMRHTVNPDGTFADNVREFAGQNVRDALVPILQDLTAKERLYAKQTITHSYPFCWRCKTALIYYAKDSWYVAMSSLRDQLVANNKEVAWIPEHIRDGRFGDFLKDARDWAISRERFWGIPMPVWTSESGKQLCVGSFDELKSLAMDPSQIGPDFDPHRPDVDQVVLVKDGEEYRREPYVLDIWFDSGAMPYASGREEAGLFPADYIAEAVDQTRGWFYSLMAEATALGLKSPFKRVVCMGHLVDETGKKMSKSLGNVIDPWEAFSWHGADAIRWFLYTVNSPGEAKAFGRKELSTSFRKSLLLLWNVFNYFVTYANLAGFEAPSLAEREGLRDSLTFDGQPLQSLDRWMLSRQASVSKQVTQYLDEYDFMRAGRLLEQYIDELSTWYLRRSRKREDSQFFAVMYDVLMNLVTMMAPMTPYVAETIYRVLRRQEMPESVHLQDWFEPLAGFDGSIEAGMQTVRQAVELGLSVRASEKIKVRQPLAKAVISSDDQATRELFDHELRAILADELNVEDVVVAEKLPDGMPTKTGERGLSVSLDTLLSDELIAAGQARDLLRNLQQLRKRLGLQPGQMATLVVGESQRSLIEPLFAASPDILADAFLKIDPEKSWGAQGSEEIVVNDQTIYVDLVA